MRPPEALPQGRGQSSGLSDSRLLLSRIGALNDAAGGATGAGPSLPQPISPATGANALPASPPLTDRAALMPGIRQNQVIANLPRVVMNPRFPARGSPVATQEALEIMRLGFESPSETPAATTSRSLKGAPTAATSQPLIDDGLFTEQIRHFPVPKYLDYSVWRSRMFTYPSPTPTAPRSTSIAGPSSSQTTATAYSTLLNAASSSPPRPHGSPPAQRKSQLAASLASSGSKLGDDWTIPLPTCWDQEDRCALVEVTGDGLEVSFCGSGKNGDRDAAAVRANRHMPSYTGIYYYEVEIVSKGQSGYIAIGFSGLNVSLSRLPGWEANSWGYHGDDGHSFASQGTGRAYGPTFSTGDVVGCGIDFTQQNAFFTKNGAFLGPVFENLEGQLYPSVGMRTPGEVVRANFGQAPFRFDIESFVAARQLRLLKSIQETSVPDRLLIKSSNEEPRIPPEPIVPEAERSQLSTPAYHAALDDTVAALVSAYLTFHGFTETASAFEAQRSADRRRYADLSPLPQSNGHHHTENGDVEMNDEPAIDSRANVMGARQKICRCVMSGRPDEALEMLEESFPAETVSPIGPLAEIVFRLRCQHFIELILSSAAQSSLKGKTRETSPTLGALDLALDYGRELQSIYGADERDAIKEGLRRTFALWAYDDPKSAEEDEVRWLASQASRDKLADDLNAAILDAGGHAVRPVLETVFKQAVVTVAEVGRSGHGGASLVNVAEEIFRQ